MRPEKTYTVTRLQLHEMANRVCALDDGGTGTPNERLIEIECLHDLIEEIAGADAHLIYPKNDIEETVK